MNKVHILEKLKENSNYLLKDSFISAEAFLSDKTSYDATFSGTTSVVIFLIGNKIISVNSGDSRAIMAYDGISKKYNCVNNKI